MLEFFFFEFGFSFFLSVLYKLREKTYFHTENFENYFLFVLNLTWTTLKPDFLYFLQY